MLQECLRSFRATALVRVWNFQTELPRPGRVALGTSTTEPWIQRHGIMTAVLAAEPPLDSLGHLAKFTSDSAIGTADGGGESGH